MQNLLGRWRHILTHPHITYKIGLLSVSQQLRQSDVVEMWDYNLQTEHTGPTQ